MLLEVTTENCSAQSQMTNLSKYLTSSILVRQYVCCLTFFAMNQTMVHISQNGSRSQYRRLLFVSRGERGSYVALLLNYY